MRYFQAQLARNQRLGGGYFLLELTGCEALAGCLPGQFVMVRGDWERDPLLPRAFSVMAAGERGRAELLAKVVGRGTALLERAPDGAPVHVLGPLGNGFPPPERGWLDLLVAGGVGLPPLLMQAELAARSGLAASCELLYGGRRAVDIVLRERLAATGARLHLATEDGSLGHPGRITEVLTARLAELSGQLGGRSLRVLACGPNPMLHAVGRICAERGLPAFLSLEEVMACGIGVCLGCAVPARGRPFRYVCKDGPVFPAEEVLRE